METSSAVRSSNPKISSAIRSQNRIKMMTKCIVCSTRRRPSTTTCFFSFPTDIKRKMLWMKTLNLKAPIKNWYKICNNHFKNDQFVCCKRRDKLLPSAVPFSPLSCEKYKPRDLPSTCSPSIIDLTCEEDISHNLPSSCISSPSNDNNYKNKLPQSFSLTHAPILQDHVYAKEKIQPLSLPSVSSIDHDYVKKTPPSLSSCDPSTLDKPNCVKKAPPSSSSCVHSTLDKSNCVKKAPPSLSSCVHSTLDKPNCVKKAPPSLSSCVPSTLDNLNCEPKILHSLLTYKVPKTLRRYITLKKQIASPLKSVSPTECNDELLLPKQTIKNLNSNRTENLENTHSSTPKKRKNCSVADKMCNFSKKYKLLHQKYNNLHSKYKRLNKMFCDHLKQCNMSDVVLFDSTLMKPKIPNIESKTLYDTI